MNIVKKLKLALLATSVMLFPKAGHSMMKSEDEGGKTGPSIQRAGPEDETASTRPQPASSSNSLPAASVALTLQQTIIPGNASKNDMRTEFHREFQSSEEIKSALTSLRNKYIKTNERIIDVTNYDTTINYIRQNIFEQYVFPYNIASQWGRSTDIDIDSNTMKVLGPTLRNLALTSLNIVLEGGTDALENRLNKINEIIYHRLRNVAMNDPLVNNLKAQRDELFYLSFIKKPIKSFLESQRNPHYISLISDLLRLQPEQMESFTSIINNKKRFMDKIETNDSLFLPVFRDIDTDMLREERISTLGFLAKKSTEELNEIQNELEKLVPEKSRGSKMHRNMLKELMLEDKDFNPSQINKIAKSQPSADIESGPASSNVSSVDQEKVRQMTPSSSSTPAPVVPALELEAREFHMGKSNPYPTTGFSAFEGAHRWTEGENASITLPLADMERRPSSISFLNTRGLVTASHEQELFVKVNGEVIKHYVYTLNDNNQRINVPLPPTGPATIEFEIPNAKSPSELGINPDPRELGISFGEVKFSFD